jgi:hypothetical protein
MRDEKHLVAGALLTATRDDLRRLHFKTGRSAGGSSVNKDKEGRSRGFDFVEMSAVEEGDVPYTRREDRLKNNVGQRNAFSPHPDYRMSGKRGEPRRVRRRKQFVFRSKNKDLAAFTAKKSKTNIALLEVKRKFVFLLLDTDELGLRLLVTLRAHPLLSTSELIALVLNAGVDSVAPALARLKRTGLVSLQDDRFSCTDAGGELLRRIEELAGKELDSGLDQEETRAVIRYAVRRVLLSRESGEVNKSQMAAAPAPEFVEGYDEAMNDPNYRAYLAERAELEASGKKLLVAYSGGKKIAEAKTIDDLLAQIERSGENGEVLIQEVPEKVINFRQPFQVVA